MDTYIVRIYQRNDNDPDMLAGIVEIPGVAEPKPFNNINGLLNILGQKKDKSSAPSKKSKKVPVDEIAFLTAIFINVVTNPLMEGPFLQ